MVAPFSLRSTDYRADLDGFTAGGALGVAEQWSGTSLLTRRGGSMELAWR